MFLTFAVRPLHPCFHGSLYGVPSMPLRAAIYRSLLLYCNRTLNAFRPRGSPAAVNFFFPQVETIARVNAAAVVAAAAGEIARISKRKRRKITARNTFAIMAENQIVEPYFRIKRHFPWIIVGKVRHEDICCASILFIHILSNDLSTYVTFASPSEIAFRISVDIYLFLVVHKYRWKNVVGWMLSEWETVFGNLMSEWHSTKQCNVTRVPQLVATETGEARSHAPSMYTWTRLNMSQLLFLSPFVYVISRSSCLRIASLGQQKVFDFSARLQDFSSSTR